MREALSAMCAASWLTCICTIARLATSRPIRPGAEQQRQRQRELGRRDAGARRGEPRSETGLAGEGHAQFPTRRAAFCGP